jgi:hypothetical protein
MYPSGENFTTLMSVAFLDSLLDANMTMPNTLASTALFPTDRIKIVLGNDAAVVGSKDVITLPLNLPTSYIAIGRPYGTEHGYIGTDSYVDVRCYIPFSVYAMSAATQDDIEQRLLFSRQHRQNVYSTYNLDIIVANTNVRGRPRIPSPITGLYIIDYAWEFYYDRT